MIAEKRQALTRRVHMLIARLQREFGTWNDHDSTALLIKYLNLIIWAFERSMPPDEWEPFRQQFLDTRYLLQDTFEVEDNERGTYGMCLQEIESTLHSYLEYITIHDIDVVMAE